MRAFISYAHADEEMLKKLDAHMAMLRRDGTLSDWYDREINAGGDIDSTIAQELHRANLFLALISPDFLNSQYCYEKEMATAIDRHEAGEITIVPIILEPCDWVSSPLARFKALPRDGKPISEWTNQNTAFLDVVRELRRLISAPSALGSKEPDNTTPSASERAGGAQSKYRVKRSFDQIDRDDFRAQAYEVIREYFEKSTLELDGIEDLRGRYQSMGPLAFTCTIVNHLLKDGRSGTASITVHAGNRLGLGDISYAQEANSPGNTSNGSFRIEADEYHLYLRANLFDMSDPKRTWSPQEAAQRLWGELLGRAGIEYG
jgi:hypothetical protein